MKKPFFLALLLIFLALTFTSTLAKKGASGNADDDDIEIVEVKDASATAGLKVEPPKPTSEGAFVASFTTIVVSELGDKTFFIAAIMSMRYNRLAVLIGALGALFTMTAISAAFGQLATALIPPIYTHIVTTGLFFFFGVKLLWDSYHHESDGGQNEELTETIEELDKLHKELVGLKRSGENGHDEESTSPKKNIDLEAAEKPSMTDKVGAGQVTWQAFILTFLGEWGDRSQVSTIALAANNNVILVFIGGFLGHCVCTGLAVWGGKYLANRISEKMVNLSGGVLFLLFGLHNVFFH